MTQRHPARLLGLAGLVIAGAFALAVLLAAPADPEFGYDSVAYFSAAADLAAGRPLYPSGVSAPVGYTAYFYPPTTALLFLPLTLVPTDTAVVVWFACLVGLAIAVGVALVRRVPPGQRPVAAAAYLAYLPLLSELRFGNLNLVTLGLVLIAWAARRRPGLAGCVMALAIGIKLLPLALVAFLAAAGRWRMLAAAAATAGAVVGVSVPWLGQAWVEYGRTLMGIGVGTPAGASNIVPDFVATSGLRYLLPGVSIAVAVAAGWFTRGSPEREDQALFVALAAAPLLTTTVWYTYLVLALPVLVGISSEGRLAAGARAAAWLGLQARLSPLPLVGVGVAIAAGLWRLASVAHPVAKRTSSVPAAPNGVR